MGRKQSGRGKHLHFFPACLIISLILICGCADLHDRLMTGPDFKRANDFAEEGNYNASIVEYEKIIAQYPHVGDRVLFDMGFIYISAKNNQKDYRKSLECFQKLVKNYPDSKYKQSSDTMISLLTRMNLQKRQNDELVQQIERMKEVDMNLKQKKKSMP